MYGWVYKNYSVPAGNADRYIPRPFLVGSTLWTSGGIHTLESFVRWPFVSATEQCYGLHNIGSDAIAITYDGADYHAYITDDTGDTWTETATPTGTPIMCATYDSGYYYATSTKVYLYEPVGDTWDAIHDWVRAPLTPSWDRTIVQGGYWYYCGVSTGDDGGIYRYNFDDTEALMGQPTGGGGTLTYDDVTILFRGGADNRWYVGTEASGLMYYTANQGAAYTNVLVGAPLGRPVAGNANVLYYQSVSTTNPSTLTAIYYDADYPNGRQLTRLTVPYNYLASGTTYKQQAWIAVPADRDTLGLYYRTDLVPYCDKITINQAVNQVLSSNIALPDHVGSIFITGLPVRIFDGATTYFHGTTVNASRGLVTLLPYAGQIYNFYGDSQTDDVDDVFSEYTTIPPNTDTGTVAATTESHSVDFRSTNLGNALTLLSLIGKSKTEPAFWRADLSDNTFDLVLHGSESDSGYDLVYGTNGLLSWSVAPVDIPAPGVKVLGAESETGQLCHTVGSTTDYIVMNFPQLLDGPAVENVGENIATLWGIGATEPVEQVKVVVAKSDYFLVGDTVDVTIPDLSMDAETFIVIEQSYELRSGTAILGLSKTIPVVPQSQAIQKAVAVDSLKAQVPAADNIAGGTISGQKTLEYVVAKFGTTETDVSSAQDDITDLEAVIEPFAVWGGDGFVTSGGYGAPWAVLQSDNNAQLRASFFIKKGGSFKSRIYAIVDQGTEVGGAHYLANIAAGSSWSWNKRSNATWNFNDENNYATAVGAGTNLTAGELYAMDGYTDTLIDDSLVSFYWAKTDNCEGAGTGKYIYIYAIQLVRQ